MEKCRIVFSGSGGQGVITAAIILAEAAAIVEGLNATQSQSYGAAARGGATRTDVIISEAEILYPKVIQPNVLVCLTQASYGQFSGIIRPGGLLLLDTRYVQAEKKVDARQVGLPMYKTVTAAIGNPVAFNLCMLGALVQITGLVKPESVMKVLAEHVPAGFLDMNRQAMALGMDLGRHVE